MKTLGKLLAMIPARGGSKRVPSKNLRFLAGKPMLAYSVECALSCPEIQKVYVNTDDDTLEQLAIELGAEVYRRPAYLGKDDAKGDDFAADFIKKLNPDTLLMVNPVCPLVQPSDISQAIKAYRNSPCDTLITVSNTQMQTFCHNRPVNISLDGQLAPTQNNPPVQILNWAVTIWDAIFFLENYERLGRAYIGTNRLLFPISPIKSIKISTEEDFQMADLLIQALAINKSQHKIKFWVPGR